ncbi:MAG TPA: hypothetical protein V6D20_19275 [Candidatus Obscuribacterales bacterium]
MVSVSYGCASSNAPSSTTPDTSAVSDAPETEEGLLQVRANGEDFVREGFVSKDGWEIGFDHVYVNLANVKAYQTDASFDPEVDTTLEPNQDVMVVEQQTVDLAEGEADADPILLAEVSAPAGRYNALEWTMPKAADGPAAGHVLMLVGTAEKDGQVVNFTLRLDQEMRYVCGNFVGDERKGILEAGSTADLEATFHFDHIFGDGEAASDDSINTGALGFEPLAAIAQGDTLDVDMTMLEEQLSPDDYTRLQDTIAGLGHVGEGHCALEEMA